MTASGRDVEPDQPAGSATVTGMLAAADLRRGDMIAARYRIERLLGMGGMGVVYLAHDIELDVPVALKLLRPELAARSGSMDRFRQELLLARQVSSPHVVRIHDLVPHAGAWLISMDYVEGDSLERVLDKKGPLEPAAAVAIARQLALGLAAAHQRRVVHRDLKPANVLISPSGEAYITDFGVARSAGVTGLTASGVIIGTPDYLSPEQARAEPVDGRSDLYALGLILFEMLTGKLPFREGTPAEMLAQRIVRNPPSVDTLKPDTPAWIVRLVARLLELNPARRFQTAETVVAAIDVCRVPRSANAVRRGAMFALAAVAAILIGAFGWHRYATRDERAAVAVVQPQFSAAVLPFTVVGNDADRALANGIARYLTESLATDAPTATPDTDRISRALAELGFDADGARRHADQVAQALRSRALVEGELRHEGDAYRVLVRVTDPTDVAHDWTSEQTAANAAALPAALAQVGTALRARLNLAASATPWPNAEALAALGNAQSGASTTVDALVASARKTKDPTLWTDALLALDRSERNADAASAARAASEALDGIAGAAADRTRAHAAILLGEHERAIPTLRARVQAAPEDQTARLLLGRAEGESGDLDAALTTLGTLVSLDPRDIEAWFLLGKYSIIKGDIKRAVDEYLVRALVLANRLEDRRMQGNVANALGVGYRQLGQLKPAAEQYEKAARLRGEVGDGRGEAVSLRNLATIRSIQGDFPAAETALKQAREILEPLGDSAAMAGLVNDVGVLWEERGEYRRALDSYREALALRQTKGDDRLVGESLINVGFAYYQVGEFDNAIVYWRQAADQYAKIDDRGGAVRAQQSLGLAQVARGEFADARKALDASLREAEERQLAEERIVSLAGLAELDRLEGQFASALTRASAALELFKRREDPRGTVEMQLTRAATFVDLGDWTEATSALDGLTAESVANREQLATLLTRQGDIAVGGGHADQALGDADKAIAEATGAHSLGTELQARLLRARALSALNKHSDAVAEVRRVREGAARYASVPLRLTLAETALLADPSSAEAEYRQARAQLSRLPSFGRAFAIHAAAARALRGDAAAEAARAASETYAHARSNTPAANQPALAALARRVGIDATAP